MYRPLTATALLTLALAAHAGGIYKCQIDGRTVYQQVACPAGQSARVEVTDTPPSSRGGGLRDAEVQALRRVLQEKARDLPGNDLGVLSERDASFIASIYRQLETRRSGPNHREAEIAERNLRQTLRRYDLELEQVEPELPGESILDRIQDELAVRQVDPEVQARYRAERRQLLEAQPTEKGMEPIVK